MCVNYFLCHLYSYYYSILLMLQDNNEYVPKRNRWNRLEMLWSIMCSGIQYIFDLTYDWITSMKVPKSKKRHHKSAKRINNNLVYSRRQRYIIVNESRTKKKSKCSSRNVLFDSDAKQIGIDNRCSACISHDINDFVGPVTRTKKTIRSFGGNNQMKVYQGTITWSWADDDGNQRKFRIPNSFYVPEGRSRLLSSQHWASSQPKDTYAQGR